MKLSFCTVLFVTVFSFCSKLAVYKSKFNDRVTVRFVVTVECFKNTAQYKMHFYPWIVSQNKCNILKCIVAISKYTTYLWKLVCWFVLRHKHLTFCSWKKMHQLLLVACNRKRSHVMTVFMWSRKRSSPPNVTKTFLFPQFTGDSIQASMLFSFSTSLFLLFCLVRVLVHFWCRLDQFGLAVNFKTNRPAVNLSL